MKGSAPEFRSNRSDIVNVALEMKVSECDVSVVCVVAAAMAGEATAAGVGTVAVGIAMTARRAGTTAGRSRLPGSAAAGAAAGPAGATGNATTAAAAAAARWTGPCRRRATSASSRSSLAPATLVSISTNMRTFPWRRRARTAHRTLPRLVSAKFLSFIWV